MVTHILDSLAEGSSTEDILQGMAGSQDARLMADEIRARQWELLRLFPFEAWPLSGGQQSLRRTKNPATLPVDTRDRNR